MCTKESKVGTKKRGIPCVLVRPCVLYMCVCVLVCALKDGGETVVFHSFLP